MDQRSPRERLLALLTGAFPNWNDPNIAFVVRSADESLAIRLRSPCGKADGDLDISLDGASVSFTPWWHYHPGIDVYAHDAPIQFHQLCKFIDDFTNERLVVARFGRAGLFAGSTTVACSSEIGLTSGARLSLIATGHKLAADHYQVRSWKGTFDEEGPMPEVTNSNGGTRAPEPVGAYPYVRRAGGLLFISGVGPRQRDSKDIPGVTRDAAGKMTDYDMAAQVHAVMQNLRWILEENGSSWDKLVDMTCFLTDMPRDFTVYNKLYAQYFPQGPSQPCRTTLGIAHLPQAGNAPIAFEVKAIASL